MGEFRLPPRQTMIPSFPTGRLNKVENDVKKGLTNPVNHLDFNTSYTPTGTEPTGSLFYNPTHIAIDVKSNLNLLGNNITGVGNLFQNSSLWRLYSDGSASFAGSTAGIDNSGGIYGNSLSIPIVYYSTSYTPTGSEPVGSTYWNSTDGTLDLVQSGATQQIGQEMFIKVINKSGSTITNGTPVYFSGRQGNRPKILPAKGDSESTSMVMGVLTQDIANNAEGFITTFGYVRQIKTNYSGSGAWGTTWAEGDNLYVSKTVAGGLTNVEPAVPHHSDIVGQVGIVGADGVGSIFVNIDRHKTLEELSNVNGTPLTHTGQLPVYNSTNNYFDFNYNLVKKTHLETSINAPTFTYTSGVLTNITYSDGSSKNLTYNLDGTLHTMTVTFSDSSTVVKTFNYTGSLLTSITIV